MWLVANKADIAPSTPRLHGYTWINRPVLQPFFYKRGSHRIGSSWSSVYFPVCCHAPGLSSTSAVSNHEAELILGHFPPIMALTAVMYHDFPLQPFYMLLLSIPVSLQNFAAQCNCYQYHSCWSELSGMDSFNEDCLQAFRDFGLASHIIDGPPKDKADATNATKSIHG